MTPYRRTMRMVTVLAAALIASRALVVSRASAADLTPLEAQRRLEGRWAGDGTTLTIDTERLQGNVDPDKPFEWRAFRIVDVAGRMVIFDIGNRRYLAMLDLARTLRVTSPSFQGERALHLVRR